ncbi:hypothetical protein [Clostridium baratii]|uniref:hypothetical protein n=1 Tax=Clostridium baratii TaxID=1561 RepID=UPI003D7B8A14
MSDNINNFIYCKILDESRLKKNERILKTLFGIDMNYVDIIFDDINNYNGYEYGARCDFFDININYDVKGVLESIHRITLYILDIYNIDVSDYFFQENYYSKLGFQEDINTYIFNNLKYKLYIEYELNENSELITRKKAIKKYMETYDSQYKLYIYNSDFENKIENKNRNIIKKIKRLKENYENWEKIESVYIDKNKIYDVVSNAYIEIIENHSKNLFYNDYNIKKTKYYCLSNIISHLGNYINNTRNFSEIYYFERSTNISFILNMYKNITGINDETKKYILYSNLININYLPNIIDNNYFIKFFVNYISKEEDYDKFIEKTNRFCFELAFFTIPLYEMIFASVVKRYCNKKEIEYDTFLGAVYKEFNINNIKNNILNTGVKKDLKYEKIFIDNNNELREFIKAFNEIFDLNIFNKKNTISWIGKFDKELIKNIKDDNIEEYQKILKSFFVDIINI